MASVPLYSHRRDLWTEFVHSPIGSQAHDRDLDPAEIHPTKRALIFKGCDWLAPAVQQALKRRGYRYYGSYAAPRGYGPRVGSPIHVLRRGESPFFIECSTTRIAILMTLDLQQEPGS